VFCVFIRCVGTCMYMRELINIYEEHLSDKYPPPTNYLGGQISLALLTLLIAQFRGQTLNLEKIRGEIVLHIHKIYPRQKKSPCLSSWWNMMSVSDVTERFR